MASNLTASMDLAKSTGRSNNMQQRVAQPTMTFNNNNCTIINQGPTIRGNLSYHNHHSGSHASRRRTPARAAARKRNKQRKRQQAQQEKLLLEDYPPAPVIPPELIPPDVDLIGFQTEEDRAQLAALIADESWTEELGLEKLRLEDKEKNVDSGALVLSREVDMTGM
ncbi:hypothetical protein B0T21DRAFT_451137 [Apiosordaria backusii]|uniref:Uncharacterized protein n=1 Tax=Apiosordaria backusii TaxID=314023 RepID=A0AA40BLJ7_9PEZI|nr:hypothetical protein B0T21DRAFT_451137 [Apiosordaria backusii]